MADHLCDPIERVPEAGELVTCEHLPLAIGGCASNLAIDLTRLGASVGVVGCVGQDAFGRYIIDTLSAAGADVADIHERTQAGTSGTLIINVRGEDRRFIHAIGANGLLRAEGIPLDRVRKARVLYVGGYLLMPALEAEPLAEVFRQARAAGVKTVLDIVLPGPGDHWPKLECVLRETDVFLPNHDEAAALLGEPDPFKQADRFTAAGAGAVVITCGGQGSVVVAAGRRMRSGTYPVEFKGGTGAGDAFDAGFIRGLLLGEDLEGCVRWGSAVGASCVRSISATDGVFTRDQAEAFMREHVLSIEHLA